MSRNLLTWCLIGLAIPMFGCRGATRGASSPHSTTVTSATAPSALKIERLLVAEHGDVAMVARGGCLATLRTGESEAGGHDELRVRCPKPERMKAWFEGMDRLAATVSLAAEKEEEGDKEGSGDDSEHP